MDYAIDVILLSHNRLDLTMRAINALYSHTDVPFHLIVLDDSGDLTPLYFNALMQEKDNITYLRSEVPYTSGNQMFNLGLAKAKTPFVATVMNSIRVEPEWQVQALELMKQRPKLGIVGFKCLFPDGRIESAGLAMMDSKIVDMGRYFKVATQVPVDIARDGPGHRQSLCYECPAVQWAFALLRREAIPVLEEDVYHGFKGWDDIDNCFVVKKGGWEILYCGTGVAYHTPRATRGDDSDHAAQLNKENAIQFFRRWGYLREDTTDSTVSSIS